MTMQMWKESGRISTGLERYDLPGGRYVSFAMLPRDIITWTEFYSNNELTSRGGTESGIRDVAGYKRLIINNLQSDPLQF